MFITQLAVSVAAGEPFLRAFDVPQSRKVGIVQTELHPNQLGERLATMFPPGTTPPSKMLFADETWMRQFRLAKNVDSKLTLIRNWVDGQSIDVLVIDPAGDVFRQGSNPSDETEVAAFFDRLRTFHLKGTVLVRHDHKPKAEDHLSGNTNDRIRGSSEWKEDPETILFLKREDRRLSKIVLEVGKMRYGQKPDPIELWFDGKTFRLVPLPPVIACLENSGPLTRADLARDVNSRFGLSVRKIDDQVGSVKAFLREHQQGHEKVFEIDWDRVVASGEDEQPTPWLRYLHREDVQTGVRMAA
jgi:hypothetical protein